MKNPFLISFFSLLILFSCKRVGSDSDADFLDLLVMTSYEFYFNSTINQDNLLPNKDLAEVQRLAALALENEADGVNCEYHLNFLEHTSYFISKQLNNIQKSQIVDYYNKLVEPISKKVRTLEYIAINAAIMNNNSFLYPYNRLEVFVIPEKNNISKGNYYKAEILMAVNNYYNPIGLIVDNDTIYGNNGVAIDYQYLVTKRGLNQKEATFIINIGGEIIKLPLLIEFYAD